MDVRRSLRRPRGAAGRARVAVVAALALAVLPGCRDQEPATAAGAACGSVTHPPRQAGGHLLGDARPPVPYGSTPPTSGWHTAGATPVGVAPPDDPLSEPEQVSVLEQGGVVVSYHDLPAERRSALAAHVRDQHAGTVAMTPYDALEPGTVAFTAWGVRQRCRGVDTGALDAFVEVHGGGGPDGGH